MSRTWREIPDNGLRDRDERNAPFAYEEKKGRVHDTKKVRDKDNHGCTYSRPKSFRKDCERKHRSEINDILQKFVNENYKFSHLESGYCMRGEELILPKPPTKNKEYYW